MEISKDLSFDPKTYVTIQMSRDALKVYHEHFNQALSLSLDCPIFVDTNVLLNYYEISIADRQHVIQFIRKYKDRIKVTKRVQNEFLRNRQTAISNFFDSLEKIETSYNERLINSITNGFQDFLGNKILRKDFSGIHSRINEIYTNIDNMILSNQTLSNEIQKSITEVKSKYDGLPFEDSFLDILSELTVVENLSNKELEFIVSQYESLKNQYNEARDGQKIRISFPGCNEKKDKQEGYGDLIIYYEMTKYMHENNCHAIFLTNDFTKGDWVREDRSPFVHYIEQTYKLTEKSLFTLHAEKILPEISFDRIYAADPGFQKLNNAFQINYFKLVESVYNNLSGDIKYSNATLSIKPLNQEIHNVEFPDFNIVISMPDDSKIGVKVMYRARVSLKGFIKQYRKRLRQTEKSIENKIIESAIIYIIFPTGLINLPEEIKMISPLSKIQIIIAWHDVDDKENLKRLAQYPN